MNNLRKVFTVASKNRDYDRKKMIVAHPKKKFLPALGVNNKKSFLFAGVTIYGN